ncbi:MAG: MBL fold metallo-hydrolase [Nevskiaceae bacterium]|jgi:glyoxylase-like metal-dependent hydrolase (beta-lactamase superfamily II)|nr:MBL fold metallo-hydrolase [Nevskiaceae bacterium]
MTKRIFRQLLIPLVLACAALPALAQNAATVIANSARAMGIEGLNSIYYYGSGANYSIGQNNNANIPWPQTPLNDYVRAIDFTVPASRATWQTYAEPVTGGAASLQRGQQNINPNSPGGWTQQLEIWTTPWGFLKGAAANNATVKRGSLDGKRYQVVTWNAPVKSPGGQNYRVVGYINADGLVERVQTWVEQSIYGDMLVDTTYSFYRSNAGLMYPTQISQSRGGWPVFTAQILGAWPNPAKLAELMAVPAPAGGGGGGPPGGAAPAQPLSEQLAPGVYRITGAYGSMAVEFADHVVLFEPGPQSEARALAGIAEVRRLIPNKPIRYGVITHHHFDHTGGIAAAVAEGITIVTPEVNKRFLENALSGPRTLAPDALAKSGRKAVVEGFKGDKRVFTDGSRTLEIHVIQGLPHADGLVIGWLPQEKILVYADMFNFPPANDPVPNPQVIGTRVFYENILRLGLNPERILSIHQMNPNRLATLQDIRSSLGL